MSTAGNRNNRRGGRIRPDERHTNDTAPLLGAALGPASETFNDLMHETEEKGMTNKNRKDYRRRMQRICEFWQKENPEYFAVGVVEVTEEARANKRHYYFNYKYDLKYEGLNHQYFLHFLLSTKKKADGKFKSIQDLRKYKDAVQWGADTLNVQLPTSFYMAWDKFHKAYKKEFAGAKKEGMVDEQGADPIPYELYVLILGWAIKENNIFVWFWTICQWNFMARSANIDDLGLHNLSIANDSIIGKYDTAKMQTNGEKLSEKNVYANPGKGRWTECFWTGLGIWCCLNQVRLDGGNDLLFLDKGVKRGSAASKYCEQLLGIVKRYVDIVMNHMNVDNFNAYGWRKGSATKAVTGVTAPPPIPSVARRGEWSIGSVLDLYWHFGSVGDQYLGRILAGLDPTNENFGILPPHWTLVDPMSNAHVKEAMELMFGSILVDHPRHTPLLLRCLACIVHHSDELIAEVTEMPEHDFSKLGVLHKHSLLAELKTMVTTDPTPGVVTLATGIPAHVGIQKKLDAILEKANCIFGKIQSVSTEVVSAIDKAIEEKAINNGQITGDRMVELLGNFEQRTLDKLSTEIQAVRHDLNALRTGAGLFNGNDDDDGVVLADDDDEQGRRNETIPSRFVYNGRFYPVPQSFNFPTAPKLYDGLQRWFHGHTAASQWRVIPFRKLRVGDLPTAKLKGIFKTSWAFLKILENEVDAELPSNTRTMTEDDIKAYYTKCIAHLKERYSYCFKGKKSPLKWTLGTWRARVSRSEVVKKGTEDDIGGLGEATSRNKGHGPDKRTRKRAPKAVPLYPERQLKRATGQSRGGTAREANETEAGQQTQRQQAILQRQNQRQRRPRQTRQGRQRRGRGRGQRVQRRAEGAKDTSTAFEAAFAPLLPTYTQEESVQREAAALKRAEDEEAKKRTERRARLGIECGRCAVAGCKYPEHELRAIHKCLKCRKIVHVLCTMENGLICEATNKEYCSPACKASIA